MWEEHGINLFASLMTTEMLGNFSDCVLASAAGGSSVLSSDIQLQCFLVQETTAVELFGGFSREPTEMAESVSAALSLSILLKRHSITQNAAVGREKAQEVIRCRQ